MKNLPGYEELNTVQLLSEVTYQLLHTTQEVGNDRVQYSLQQYNKQINKHSRKAHSAWLHKCKLLLPIDDVSSLDSFFKLRELNPAKENCGVENESSS